jgi:hypothetical protein
MMNIVVMTRLMLKLFVSLKPALARLLHEHPATVPF